MINERLELREMVKNAPDPLYISPCRKKKDEKDMKITISKIEAAQRQLRAAIKLWFCEGDIIAVLSLVCSAHQIIHDINKKKGSSHNLIYDSPIVKDNYRKDWINKIKSPYNFLKHADKDPTPDCTLELDTKVIECYIVYTIMGLEFLNYKSSEIERIFTMYFMLTNPSLVVEEERDKVFSRLTEDEIQAITKMPKDVFFNYFISQRNRLNSQ
jgi:hypothetical protein